jgi:hypothetical protein
MYYIIKAQAGLFFEETTEPLSVKTVREHGSIVLLNARRLWLMEGVCSLKHLAKSGTATPSKCKVPCPVQFTTLYGVQDIIEAAEACKASLELIPEWTAWPKDTPWRSDEFDDRLLVRTKNAVFFTKSAEPVNMIDGLPAMRLKDGRRIRSWTGACSLSELAQRGVSDPELCIFEAPAEGTIEGIIEVACVTKQAASTLDAVKE